MPSVTTTALLVLTTLSWNGAAEAALTGDRIATDEGEVVIHPIEHATFVMSWNHKTLYVDPVGGAERFQAFPKPDLILVTDIHGDHMDAKTLEALVGTDTVLVAPPAV